MSFVDDVHGFVSVFVLVLSEYIKGYIIKFVVGFSHC